MTPIRGPVCVLRVIVDSVTVVLVIEMLAVLNLHWVLMTGMW